MEKLTHERFEVSGDIDVNLRMLQILTNVLSRIEKIDASDR